MKPSNAKSRRRPARAVSELVGKVLEPVMARRSGMTLDLIAGWKEIAGASFCDNTRPEKIRWPNRATGEDPFEPGTLVVACDGGVAIFFQHEVDRVLERVNAFFGYRAISKIKIEQRPITKPQTERKEPLPPLNQKSEERLERVLSHVEDDDLRQRLEQFGKGVLAKNQLGRKNKPTN